MPSERDNTYVWYAVLDARTCDHCSALHGRRFYGTSADEACLFAGVKPPPCHDPDENGENGCRCTLLLEREGRRSPTRLARYPFNWHEIAERIKKLAGYKCENCGSPSVPGRILTVHHIDMDPGNNEDDNLVALCQACHLHYQAKYDPDQLYLIDGEMPEWLKKRRAK